MEDSTAMTTLFQTYEEEYREAVKTITDECAGLRQTLNRQAAGYQSPPATGAGSRVQRCRQLTATLAHARELLSGMEYESNDMPAAHRQTSKERIAEYRTKIRSLDEALAALKSDCSAADRQDLLGDAERRKIDGSDETAPGAMDDTTQKQRMLMMDNTAKVKDASNTLRKAERLLNDTEAVGSEALANLRNQTETMQHIQETTIAVDEEVSQTRKILGGMQKMMIKHKLMLIAVIAVLLFLIIVAIYVAVSKGSSNSSSASGQTSTDKITVAPS